MAVFNMKKVAPKEKVKEIIERTDPRKGEFSSSSVISAQCPRKFFLQKIVKLTSVHTSAPLVYGSAIHKGVEFYYRNRGEDMTYDELTIGCIQEFADEWEQGGISGDARRSLEGGILTLGKYCENYRTEDMRYEAENIEGIQWLPMPNGTMLQVRLDRVDKEDGMIGVVDTKTSSRSLTDWFFSQFEQSIQMTLYYHALQELLGRCDYVKVDAIKVPYPGPRSAELPFVRRSFYRTELQVAEGINTYCRITDFIMKGIRYYDVYGMERGMEYFYQNQAKCDDYGGCEFLAICKHGMDHPCVGIDFLLPEHRAEIRRQEEAEKAQAQSALDKRAAEQEKEDGN